MASESVERSEWVMAQRIVDGDPVTYDDVLALAKEVLRLRDLAYEEYELVLSHTGREVLDALSPRIDKLYMALNARARGDEADLDGDPAEPWNRLVGTLATAMAHWLANARWAVAEHRSAQRIRDAAGRPLELLACLHDFDPECRRCELLAPLRQAVANVPEKPEGAHDG